MVFQESKKYALFLGIFFMAGLTLKVAVDASKHSGEFLQFASYFLALSVVIGVFLWLYPISTLSIYEDHFEYRKGKLFLTAKWSDVKYFALSRRDLSSLFIETTNGSTKLIDARILRVNDVNGSRPSSLNELISTLQKLTGKEAVFGDISYEHHKNTVIALMVFVIAIFAFIFLAIR